jgi:hypothetical protein
MLGDTQVLEAVRCLDWEPNRKIDFTSERFGYGLAADQRPNRSRLNDKTSIPK